MNNSTGFLEALLQQAKDATSATKTPSKAEMKKEMKPIGDCLEAMVEVFTEAGYPAFEARDLAREMILIAQRSAF